MGSRKKKQCVNVEELVANEELKISVALSLRKLRMSDTSKELEFPSSLTSEERKYIHQVSQQYGLESKSRGKGSTRYLTVYKKNGSTIMKKDPQLDLCEVSCSVMFGLLQRHPVTHKERQDLLPGTEKDRLMNQDLRDLNMVRSLGRMSYGPPQVPPRAGSSEVTPEARRLPVWSMRDQLLSAIKQNQVILVRGETGSGKTTQVPQIIMEYAHMQNMPCRILCTQPRRISALSIAERVAIERGEKVGSTVGYQIRLEGKTSNKTLLTFCTTGILLRTLMGGESALSTVTHVLVDEVHERDRFTDFLLTVLRDALPKFRHLKLILMSANLDAALYAKYFNNCPIVDVPGRTYSVEPYYLEDILKYLSYSTPIMKKFLSQLQTKERGISEASEWAQNVLNNLRAMPLNSSDKEEGKEQDKSDGETLNEKDGSVSKEVQNNCKENDSVGREDMDECIHLAFTVGDDEHFSQMVYLIMSENVSPDYQHSTTWASPLMVASGRGRMDIVEQLLALGATVNLKAANEWTAIDWAQSMGYIDIVDYLQSYSVCEGIDLKNGIKQTAEDEKIHIVETSEEDKDLVESYALATSNIKSSDTDLIYALCMKIHSSQPSGGILIFLPGYEDIVTLRDRIVSEDKTFVRKGGKYIIYCLHSHMQSSDQKKVFKRAVGARKIVLATNIAETSVTINDIVYVIDCGKVKEMSFDSLSGVSCLRPVWVSQASAMQRRGRAGRCQPGISYHLISRSAFNALQPHQTPEILRSPLQDLCLHTKLLAMPNMLIADFLARAPEPPAFMAVKNAVHLLKGMDALDPWEDVTELGHHLLDLNLPPHLGKMVITATILKCLDPVLTIATCLAFRDPFTLPAHVSDKRGGKQIKQKFADGSFSDHMVLLKAYQSWQKASSQQWSRGWCDRHFISSATMEMVHGMRGQIIAQLKNAGFIRNRGPGDMRDVNTNGENWAVIKAALLSGIYPNLIRVDQDRSQLRTAKESKVRLHSSSVLMEFIEEKTKEAKWRNLNASHRVVVNSMPGEWLMFDEMIRIGFASYVKTVTLVSPMAVLLMAGPMRLPQDALSEPFAPNGPGMAGMDAGKMNSDSENEDRPEGMDCFLKIDSWVQLLGKQQVMNFALQTRQKLYALILRRLRSPHKPLTQVDEDVVRAVTTILTEEEKNMGIPQPAEFGQFLTSSFSGQQTSDLNRFSNLSLEDSYMGNSSSAQYTAPNLVQSHSYPNFGSVHQPSSAFMTNGYSDMHPQNNCLGPVPQMQPDSMGFSGSANPIYNHQFGSTSSLYGNGMMAHNAVNASNMHAGGAFQQNHNSFSNLRKRFFVVRVNNSKQIEVAQSRDLWAFAYGTEKKILQVAQNNCVILVFALNRNNQFHGFARFWGQRAEEICPEITNSGQPTGPLYKIEWIKKWYIHFHQAKHLSNPYSDNLQLHMCRDGQEIEPSVGEQLIKLWDSGPQSGGMGSSMNDQPYSGTPRNMGPSPNFNSTSIQSQHAFPSRTFRAQGGSNRGGSRGVYRR